MSETQMNQYQVVASRRQGMDTLMWQVPALSIAAQAFLLSIALNKDSTAFSAILSAALALVAALASIQLMSKHRHLEVRDSVWLENFERSQGMDLVHSKPAGPNANNLWSKFIAISSYKLWVGTLSLFGIAAIATLFKILLF